MLMLLISLSVDSLESFRIGQVTPVSLSLSSCPLPFTESLRIGHAGSELGMNVYDLTGSGDSFRVAGTRW
jgi:hypothetical protein